MSIVGWVLDRLVRPKPTPPVPEFEGLELTTEDSPTRQELVNQGILDSIILEPEVTSEPPLRGSLADRRNRLRLL